MVTKENSKQVKPVIKANNWIVISRQFKLNKTKIFKYRMNVKCRGLRIIFTDILGCDCNVFASIGSFYLSNVHVQTILAYTETLHLSDFGYLSRSKYMVVFISLTVKTSASASMDCVKGATNYLYSCLSWKTCRIHIHSTVWGVCILITDRYFFHFVSKDWLSNRNTSVYSTAQIWPPQYIESAYL